MSIMNPQCLALIGVQGKTVLIGSYPGGNKSCLIRVADKVMENGSPAQETQATTPGSISASSTVHTAVTVLSQGEVGVSERGVDWTRAQRREGK